MTLLLVVLGTFLTVLTLWVFFLAYSALLPRIQVLRPEVRTLGYFIVLVGFLIDVIFNWTIGLLLGVTSDITFSQKCGTLKKGSGWRVPVANYFCTNWLDPFQLGGHCK